MLASVKLVASAARAQRATEEVLLFYPHLLCWFFRERKFESLGRARFFHRFSREPGAAGGHREARSGTDTRTDTVAGRAKRGTGVDIAAPGQPRAGEGTRDRLEIDGTSCLRVGRPESGAGEGPKGSPSAGRPLQGLVVDESCVRRPREGGGLSTFTTGIAACAGRSGRPSRCWTGSPKSHS